MTREEVINLTDEWLRSVPDTKKLMELINIELEKENNNEATIKKLEIEKRKLKYKQRKIINAVSSLKDENQRIICYKYFDNITYNSIGSRMGYTNKTIKRRIDKSLLDIGRVLFGFEDEFWNELHL